MALHKQIKGSGYKQYEDKNILESTLFDMSKEGKRKQQDIINRLVCNIESRPATGQERFYRRQQHRVKLIYERI